MDHSTTFSLLTALALVVALAIFGMKYFSAGRIARRSEADEARRSELIDRLIAAQAANASVLSAVQADLAEIKSVLKSVVHVLEDVR